MWFLPKRSDPDCQGAARQESKTYGRSDSRGHERRTLPLHDVLPRSGRDQTRGEGDRCKTCASREGGRMKPVAGIPKHVADVLESVGTTSRRNLLKNAGMFVMSFAAIGTGPLTAPVEAQPPAKTGPYPDVDFHQLDSWIVIHEDSSVTFYVG